MKHSVQNLIRKRVINITMITIISLIISIAYLGIYRVKTEPVQIVKEINITPQT